MAIDPWHRYSKESERANHANEDIYDDFKMKTTLWSPWILQKEYSALWVKLCLATAIHNLNVLKWVKIIEFKNQTFANHDV